MNAGYTLTRLQIVKDDNIIDLSAAFIDFVIYENIFEYFMTGRVSIVDTFNLEDQFEFDGGETIEIEFFTTAKEDFVISVEAQIYKIDNRVRVTDHAQAYIIHFCSAEMIRDARSSVQRSFKIADSDVVKQIHNNTLKASEKQLIAIQSKGISTYCFGSVRATEAISVALRNTISTQNDRGYLYYENNKSFMCCPLEYLYQQSSIKLLEYAQSNVYKDVSDRRIESFNRIQDVDFLSEDCYLNRIIDGELGSSNMFFDLKTKNLQTIKYDSDTFFDSKKSLADLSSKSDQVNKDYTDVFNIEYNFDSNLHNRNLVISKYRKQEIYRTRFQIFTFGDSELKAGDCIDAVMPRLMMNPEDSQDFVSGKFLITAIKHTCDNTSYYQDIMIQKNAYEAQS